MSAPRDRSDASSGPPPDAAESRALDALAEELRSAHPQPALPPGFAAALRERWSSAWSWRHAFERSPLLRAAAVLLMMSATAVPVTALIVLLQTPQRQPLRIEILPAEPMLPGVGRARPAQSPVAPAEPDPEALLSDLSLRGAWRAAAQRDNRMAWAAQGWHETFPARFQDPAGLPTDLELPEGARRGLELRLGLRSAAATPLQDSWSDASPEWLWAELERRLARRETAPPAEELVRRIDELWDSPEPGRSAARGWLQGWRAILNGSAAPVGYRQPTPGGIRARVFWEAVPWQPAFPESMREAR